MALARFIKVGNISNLSDARYCAGMGVDLLGFRVIETATNFMSPKQFQEIRGWVTGPKIVAEIYGIDNAQKIAAVLADYRPDLVELGWDELKVMNDLQVPYILSVSEADVKKAETLTNKPAYILIKDFKNGVDPGTIPLLLELSSLRLEDIDERYSDCGLALNGSAEISPGLKSYDDLAEVLEKLEGDE